MTVYSFLLFFCLTCTYFIYFNLSYIYMIMIMIIIIIRVPRATRSAHTCIIYQPC